MFDINKILRPNIRNIQPYSSARSEYSGAGEVFLDANENPFGPMLENPKGAEKTLNRYPDPLQKEVKRHISELKSIPQENIFLGNGSDEPIDLLFRAFCRPGKDKILTFPPTYGMYKVSAEINDIEILSVPLDRYFQLNRNLIKPILDDDNLKMVWICSPNNPSGNSMDSLTIKYILDNFDGIVVIDEAYIDFSGETSWHLQLKDYPNLVVLQTFSKAWGLAGLRIGIAFAGKEIVNVLNNIKSPYNINSITQELILKAITNINQKNDIVEITIKERNKLEKELKKLSIVKEVFKSDANFILVRFTDANSTYNYLTEKNIIVRNRSKEVNCENCLRITVGTPDENKRLIEVLKAYTV